MTRVLMWVAPGVVGAEVLQRSLSEALLELDPGATLVPCQGSALTPDGCGSALLLVGGFVSDHDHLSARISALSGVIPSSAVLRAAYDVAGASSPGEMKRALGADAHLWPSDLRILVAADRSGGTVQGVESRSKLAEAIRRTAAALVTAARAARPVAREADVLADVSQRVWTSLESGIASVDVPAEIDRHLNAYLVATGAVLPASAKDSVSRRLHQDLVGFGPIEPFFEDPSVSEIIVNGHGNVFVEKNGQLANAGISYASDDRLRLAISRIVAPAGRRVDQSSPLCDVRLPDGSRANVVLPPVSVGGPLLTIRRFRPAFERMADLMSAGSLTQPQADTISRAVALRRNILVAGNSGAGKTTLLNAMASLIPDEERIITMEDAAELRIRKPHVVRLETRPPNAEGTGEISMRDLVVNALRMRPDRLIVGECRGAEAVPMLQAMNTGHDGSMTTLHANSAADALERLESMALMGAANWPVDVVRRQIRSAIHVVVYLRRTASRRLVEEILELGEPE